MGDARQWGRGEAQLPPERARMCACTNHVAVTWLRSIDRHACASHPCWPALAPTHPQSLPLTLTPILDVTLTLARTAPRGGPLSAAHVELLGNHDVLLDLAHIVAGQGQRVTRRIFSRVAHMAAAIPWDELAARGHERPE